MSARSCQGERPADAKTDLPARATSLGEHLRANGWTVETDLSEGLKLFGPEMWFLNVHAWRGDVRFTIKWNAERDGRRRTGRWLTDRVSVCLRAPGQTDKQWRSWFLGEAAERVALRGPIDVERLATLPDDDLTAWTRRNGR
jgi:hypothetical protein